MRIHRPGNRILTIGNPGLSVISPRGGAESADWWLAGGISAANAIRVYKPIGEADYAASKVNLVNPGTYDAVDGTKYPTWDSTNGWKFAGNQWLNAKASPIDFSWTYIYRISNLVRSGFQGVFGTYTNGTTANGILIPGTTTTIRFQYGNYTDTTTAFTNGVIAVAGKDVYFDGSFSTSITAGGNPSTKEMYIGGLNGFNTSYFGKLYVQAAAIYNTTLTSDQVAAVTTEMNAL